MVQVTPVPDTFTAVVPARPVPVRVTGRLVEPRNPDAGLMEVSVGAATVNETKPVVPAGVVTLTFLAVSAAPAVIVKVVVS